MPRMGCVSHNPRQSGHVCPKPRTSAAGPWGMGATTPAYRGMCRTSPKMAPPAGSAERQLTLLICQTPIAPAMATTAVAANRAG
jgi:hypothetical protein